MAYLRLRRLIELAVLDRPGLARVFRARRGAGAAPAAQWNGLYETGAYDALQDSERRHHQRLLAALVAERVPGGRVLEVGCGAGAFYASLRPFHPARYLGTDISERAVTEARARFADDLAPQKVEFRAVDGGADFVCAETFDAVILADCIEYLGPIPQVVERYGRLLAPGGIIGVTQWLALHPMALLRRLESLAEVLDEAVVSTPWGGAWQVATYRPRRAAADG